jgi:hypothetical protein
MSDYIIVGFSHDKKDFISRAIGWLTHGSYTHTVLFHPSQTQGIEASGMGKFKGVRNISLENFMKKPNAVLRKIPHNDPYKVWDIAVSQLGKKYDWSYFLGWLLRSNIQNPDKWVCQELIVWAADKAGDPILVMDNSHWLTPYHLWLISKEL